MPQNQNQLLSELLQQHDQLRVIIVRCERMAGDVDAGTLEPMALLAELAHLRLLFDVHNKYEERLLRPILRDADAFGEVRIDKMVADHIDEHRAMSEHLGSPVTSEVRDTLEQLGRHLATEERYFLSSRVLRDDLVVVEGGG